ncbi:MAG: hypothetical protein QXV17_09180 [Candidatus Micrarchaeaceae archaeon]
MSREWLGYYQKKGRRVIKKRIGRLPIEGQEGYQEKGLPGREFIKRGTGMRGGKGVIKRGEDEG